MSKGSKGAVHELEALASEYVGSSRKPVLYFVTLNGAVVTVTIDKEVAMKHARKLPTTQREED